MTAIPPPTKPNATNPNATNPTTTDDKVEYTSQSDQMELDDDSSQQSGTVTKSGPGRPAR